MATLSTDKKGYRTIQVKGRDGKRRSIRLGRMAKKSAEAFKGKVESLVAADLAGLSIPEDVAKWVGGLDQKFAMRLHKAGLIGEPVAVADASAVRLGPFLDAYRDRRVELKPRTITKLTIAGNHLVDFFGADRQLATINSGDADDYRLFLIGKGYAENTVRRYIGIAKQYFHAAVRRGTITTNPFVDLKSALRENRERDYFASHEDINKCIEECPDAEWRAILALSRYGGLRTPSEHLQLRWDDIDWKRDRFTVHSPKTEHHAGKASRVIPLFPELRPYLEDLHELAGTEFVITRYRDAGQNLRTQFGRIIKRAGLTQWPKLFQNLRASRQTELEEIYPSHVVCSWMGNSKAVAEKHYLQVTDDHFAKAVQIPVQQTTANDSEPQKADSPGNKKAPIFPAVASVCGNMNTCIVGREGLEPPTKGL